jgi:hypothetical protein
VRDVPRRGVAPVRRQADRRPRTRRPGGRRAAPACTAPAPPPRGPVNGTRPASNGRPGPGHPTNGHTLGTITPRQLDAIWKVGNAKGLDPNAVEHMSFRVFNRTPEALTQQEGAALIKELSNLNRRVA